MTTPPHTHQFSKGPANELHKAAKHGFTKRIDVMLASGIDINDGNQNGLTPLMISASYGHLRVATHLLDRGADVSRVDDEGLTALHISAGTGNLAMTEMLMTAGANLEARSGGKTPLHMAVFGGHLDVMRAMIEAGVNVDSRLPSGATALFSAASHGLTDAVEVLLGANADPMVAKNSTMTGGGAFVALDAAAECGHAEVVLRMIGKLGIEGCGGGNRGVSALYQACKYKHVDVMAILVGAGVVDNGEALIGAAALGVEASVKFLLQQHDDNKEIATRKKLAYVNSTCNFSGATPLVYGIGFGGFYSARIVRMLVDAGADTTSSLRLSNTPTGGAVFDGTPLAMVAKLLYVRVAEGGEAPEKQQRIRCELEAVRLVLLRAEAARALSWLWPSNSINSASHAAGASAVRAKVNSTYSEPLAGLTLVLRRRAVRHRVLLAALSRYSRKP